MPITRAFVIILFSSVVFCNSHLGLRYAHQGYCQCHNNDRKECILEADYYDKRVKTDYYRHDWLICQPKGKGDEEESANANIMKFAEEVGEDEDEEVRSVADDEMDDGEIDMAGEGDTLGELERMKKVMNRSGR